MSDQLPANRQEQIMRELAQHLTGMESVMEVLASLGEISPKQDSRFIDAAIRQLEEGAMLIRSAKLRMAGSCQRSEPEAVGMCGMLSDLKTRYEKRAAEQGIQFYLCFSSPLPKWVVVEKDLLTLSLGRLLERAFLQTDQGRIVLTVAHDRDRKQLLIEVSDTGTGQRWGNNRQELNVRDSLDAILSERHSDRLTVESIAGVGSRVRVCVSISDHSSDFLPHVNALPRASGDNTALVVRELSTLGGSMIGLLRSPSYRDLIRCLASHSKATLHLRQTRFQFREVVLATPTDLIVMEGVTNSDDLHQMVQEVRSRMIQTPILVFMHELSDQGTERLVRLGVEVVPLPLQLRSLVELLIRYLPHDSAAGTPEINAPVLTSSARAVKASLLATMEPEQAENVSRFFLSLPAEIGELERLLSSADPGKGAFMANELGGAACLAGLPEIGEELLAIERAAKQGRVEMVKEHISNTKKLLSDLSREQDISVSPYTEKKEAATTSLPNQVPLSQATPEEGAVVKGGANRTSVRDPIVSSVVAVSPELLPLVVEFLNSLDGYLERIMSAARESHWEALRLVSHESAGVSAMYGYQAFSALAKRLQHLAQASCEEGIGEIIEELRELAEDMKRGQEVMGA